MSAPDRCIELAAREMITSALACALTDPFIQNTTVAPSADELRLLSELWTAMAHQHGSLERSELGLGELPPAQVVPGPLVQWLSLDRSRRQRAYEAVFGLVTPRQCPPYETEYCHWTDPTYRAQQMADIAGFYNAFGLRPSDARPDRPDHVTLELEFVAFLHRKARHALETGAPAVHVQTCHTALRSFIRDHVAWWVPTFARTLELRIRTLADGCGDAALRTDLDAFAGVADALRAWVAVTRIAAGVEPSRQIVAPHIQEQPQDDACGACTASSTQECPTC